MKKACVIGHPITHSRSPLIHNYWLNKYGIDGVYEKRDIHPDDLTHFLQHLTQEGYVGCNVTIPHKEAALQVVQNLDEIVKRTGSLNTVFYENEVLCATSTDGEGFYQNLIATAQIRQLHVKKALILGAGGSAKAIIERLLRGGIEEIAIMNRSRARVDELIHQFGSQIRSITADHFGIESKTTDLLINTTSLGMQGQPDHDLRLNQLPTHAIVADIVYVPLKTKLILQADALGLTTVSGLGMLLHQAVVGFEKWFGIKPEVSQELYDLVAKSIEEPNPK